MPPITRLSAVISTLPEVGAFAMLGLFAFVKGRDRAVVAHYPSPHFAALALAVIGKFLVIHAELLLCFLGKCRALPTFAARRATVRRISGRIRVLRSGTRAPGRWRRWALL